MRRAGHTASAANPGASRDECRQTLALWFKPHLGPKKPSCLLPQSTFFIRIDVIKRTIQPDNGRFPLPLGQKAFGLFHPGPISLPDQIGECLFRFKQFLIGRIFTTFDIFPLILVGVIVGFIAP